MKKDPMLYSMILWLILLMDILLIAVIHRLF
jgi:hypothetical protein